MLRLFPEILFLSNCLPFLKHFHINIFWLLLCIIYFLTILRLLYFLQLYGSSMDQKMNFLSLVVGICLSCEIKIVSCLVKIKSFGGDTGVTSTWHRHRWWYMGAVHCPDYMPPTFSVVPARSKGIQGIIFEVGLATRVDNQPSLGHHFHPLFWVWIWL